VTAPTELQAIALKIARHRWPEGGAVVGNNGWPVVVGQLSADPRSKYSFMYVIDGTTAYVLWQEIAPKYVEKLMDVDWCSTPEAQLADAKALAYEASLSPLGIARAYREVYGLNEIMGGGDE